EKLRRCLENLHVGERPHEPLHGLQDVCDVTRTASDSREPQLSSLPFVLIPNFGGSNLIPAPGAFEDRLDEGPLLLQRVAGGEMEGDAERAYARGICRSS